MYGGGKFCFNFFFFQCPIYLFNLATFPDLCLKRFLLYWKANCFLLDLLTLDIHFALLDRGCIEIMHAFVQVPSQNLKEMETDAFQKSINQVEKIGR